MYATNQSNLRCDACAVPMKYDPELAAQGFPNPLVRLSISGHEALFIVDTGASVPTLAEWFVREVGLHVPESHATVRASTGHESRVRTVSNLSMLMENHGQLRLSEAIVVGFPQIFQTIAERVQCELRQGGVWAL